MLKPVWRILLFCTKLTLRNEPQIILSNRLYTNTSILSGYQNIFKITNNLYHDIPIKLKMTVTQICYIKNKRNKRNKRTEFNKNFENRDITICFCKFQHHMNYHIICKNEKKNSCHTHNTHTQVYSLLCIWIYCCVNLL